MVSSGRKPRQVGLCGGLLTAKLASCLVLSTG